MTQTDLQCLLGRVLDSRFKIEQVLQSVGRTAFLSATDVNDGRELLLRVEEGEEPAVAAVFDRFREAAFLAHPHLIRVFGSGRMDCEGSSLAYLLTEMPSSDLSDALQQHPMRPEEISEILKQVIAALQYLHSENLVYCALRAGSVWHVGEQWKLGDYTQLRVAGKYSAQETRRAMLLPGSDVPPEANQGSVTEAWDIWSLGSMLRKALLRSAEQEGLEADPNNPVSLNRVSIPPPFDQVLRDSLDPDPALRSSLGQILELLAAPPALHAEPVARSPLTSYIVTPPNRNSPQPKRTVLSVITAAVAVLLLGLVYSSPTVHSQVTHAQVSHKAKSAPEQVIRPINANIAPSTATEEKRPSPFGDASPAVAARREDSEAAISSLLTQWVSATRTRDVDRKVACYAPVVDRFYGQRSVPSSRLRAQEESIFSRIGPVRKFEIRNVKFNRVGPQWAVVSFDKEWEFGSKSHWAGSAREEVILRPVRGEWKIASQREVKLYWANKQAS